uniref:Uncharacterized protein n=1 Tax=viral metagenome TaxID=1070528 RepID=A0A6C0C5D4_9ZZZZ
MNIDRLPTYKIPNYVTSPRSMSFDEWLRTPVMDSGEPGDTTYRKCVCENGEWYTHQDFISNFLDDLVHIIHSSGYNIENKKQFKNEIATFVYRLSREKL